MAVLSEETSRELKMEVLEAVDTYLEAKTKLRPKLLGLVSRAELKEDLNIGNTTVRRWEKLGLRQCKPPLEDGHIIFYKIDDVLKFLGADA